MAMPELKPCPFCGGKAEMKKAWGHAEGWYIKCNKCKMKTMPILIDYPRITYMGGYDESTRYTSEQAAKIAEDMWNRRDDDAANQSVIDEINNVEEVDAESIRHGRWEWYEDPITPLSPDPDYGWRCSQCKEDAEAIIQRAAPTADVAFDNSDVPPKFDYCPNCGAKMAKEEEA